MEGDFLNVWSLNTYSSRRQKQEWWETLFRQLKVQKRLKRIQNTSKTKI